VAAFDGWRGVKAVWPAALTAGVAFAVPQFLVSTLHGPWLVDIVAGSSAIAATILLLQFWRPREILTVAKPETDEATAASASSQAAAAPPPLDRKKVALAWMPWAILTVCILCWGLQPVKQRLDQIATPQFAVRHLDQRIQRVPPVAPANSKPEKAVFNFNFLSTTGTGILVAAIVAGFAMGIPPVQMLRAYFLTIWRIRYSLVTIAAMLALGNVTKYAGTDATLGLALAKTGAFYPFFGTLLGWLGVALTGSDTASNVLFGSLQKITAHQIGVSPVLMCAANSAGGVMGKMVDAQSIVVASTATSWYGHEGAILRYVFWHSLALATLMGILVYLQAYVAPFSSMVVK
jgi:lactate permease